MSTLASFQVVPSSGRSCSEVCQSASELSVLCPASRVSFPCKTASPRGRDSARRVSVLGNPVSNSGLSCHAYVQKTMVYFFMVDIVPNDLCSSWETSLYLIILFCVFHDECPPDNYFFHERHPHLITCIFPDRRWWHATLVMVHTIRDMWTTHTKMVAALRLYITWIRAGLERWVTTTISQNYDNLNSLTDGSVGTWG